MRWQATKRPAKASGAQIGKRTVKIVACPECLRGADKTATPCDHCGAKVASFDSRGEWQMWSMLKNALATGQIKDLQRQVRMPLLAEGGVKVGALVLDYVFEEKGVIIYGDYKGGAMTELAAWKCKHFEAQYGCEVTLFGGSKP